MSPTMGGSITRWLPALKAGDARAVRVIWERYHTPVVKLARIELARGRPPGTSLAAFDENDVAQIAFMSFLEGARQGRFPKLDDRRDLWKILAKVTTRKASHMMTHEGRAKRGGRGVRHAADLLGRIPGSDPAPETIPVSVEELHRLIGLLGDDFSRRIALLKLADEIGVEELERLMGPLDDELRTALREVGGRLCTYKRIAEALGSSTATVGRELHEIRKAWEEEGRA